MLLIFLEMLPFIRTVNLSHWASAFNAGTRLDAGPAVMGTLPGRTAQHALRQCLKHPDIFLKAH